MAVRRIRLLGDPALYATAQPVRRDEVEALRETVGDLHDTLFDFRSQYGVGRAIAAPQIGVSLQVVYMHIDAPTVFLNPVLSNLSDETIELWDDCMSFPDLLVRVKRHRYCTVTYRDLDWTEIRINLADDLSELLQHEIDHLDGILAVSRAVDGRSFAYRSQIRASPIP